MRIYVGNIAFKTTEQDLQKEFESFGEVVSTKIITDRETGKSRGFGFVEMPDRDRAMAAIAAVNGKELDGYALKVNEAKPREDRGGRPGGGRSGGGGRGRGEGPRGARGGGGGRRSY